ncbi:MAG: selenium metabolism-associated LysR family transcriptional regulator [Bacillota bacterium]|nr:LysR family transcriptional regulator [Bacillota bacterium]MDW7728779.1 selenium metabolism-associated LysR family transcriptional regulator [Bacillota bacterium]
MDFEQIRAFLNVATLRSFSEAAEKMFISQPSVSIRIKALEEELGVTLFDRSKAREPSLTDAGRVFLDYAQAIVNLQDECRDKLSGKRAEAIGLIYLGASTVPGTYLLPGMLTGFKKICPGISFNIDVTDTSAVIEGVLNYSYDLGFVGLIKQDERLRYLPIGEDQLIFCVRKGLLKEEFVAEGIPAKELGDYHLILREKGSATRQLLEKKIKENGLTLDLYPDITYYNSLEGIKQAVREGLGASILSNLSIQDMIKADEIDTCPLKDLDLKRSLYLVYHHSRVLGGAALKFKEFSSGKFA